MAVTGSDRTVGGGIPIGGGPSHVGSGGGGGGGFQAAWAEFDEDEVADMFKNTASQRVGVQMVTAADGSAFTGAVTVSVTGDAGAQATGSVGAGACTHEGNGYHTYAPAQAETNYDLIAFTFTGSGAIPRTVQSWTRAGDAFTRLGAPAGASVSADVAAVKGETATILSDTNDIQTRLPAALVGGRIDANASAISGDSVAADNAEAFFDGTGYAGTGNVIPTVTTLTGHTAQTGDAFARLGAPAGASHAADIAALKVVADATLADTGTDGVVVAAGSKTGYALGVGGIGATAFAAGAIDSAAIAAGAIDADALAADAGTEIGAAVLAAATANPIDANIQEVNDIVLTGDGTIGTPWGPV